ncbi:hypothetical protein [Roseibium sp. RKSG952]|uniref:hypothetical protein n=1 Tax=Roseibium sp. RKSG952 TaxID=2529384 RepID=UPI0012BC8E67|nr:hypothetical protein [Roseibium sp. RKSG952]MTH97060.1 hypothetical protein [Roseibium sp. RKSG952]
MISQREVISALKGSWRLFRYDQRGMSQFDLSVNGFWRSFGVVFLLLPLLAVSFLAEKRLIQSYQNILPENFPNLTYWAAQLTGVGLDWVALPLVLLCLADFLGVSKGYIPFIVVRNWTSLLTVLPYFVVSVFYIFGIVSAEVLLFTTLVTLFLVIWFRYVLARIALGAASFTAIGVVMLDILLSLFVTEFAGRIWGL